MKMIEKRNANNMVELLPIYRFVKDYMSSLSVATFQKGEYLFQGAGSKKLIFYILNGVVEIENVTYSGKKLIVENVGENTFIGSVSDMHNVDLQTSGVAVTFVEALVFSKSFIDKLMKKDEFTIFFYKNVCDRIFKMYKMILAKVLFSSSEIMAYYILDNVKNEMFTFESTYKMSENIGISRRGLYDILSRFENMGCIKKRGSALYEILDKSYLCKQAEHVISFFKD